MKITLTLALASIFLLFPKNSFAQSSSTFVALQKDFLLQTPIGKTLDQTIVIKSNSPTQEKVYLTWLGYELPPNEVTDNKLLTEHSIDFVVFPKFNDSIEPFGIINLPISFNVPNRLKPGDYYGTLVISSSDHQEKTNFTIRVLGQLNESIHLKSFRDTGMSTILEFENIGNRTSKVSVKNLLTYFFNKEINLNTSFELKAGEKKTVKQNHQQLLPGFYEAKVSTSFGEKNTTVTKLYSFWVRGEFFIFSLITLITTFIIFLSVKKSYRDV